MDFNFYYFNVVQLIFLIFYLIYYSKLKPILGFIQSFLSGFLGGFIILLSAPFLLKYIDYKNDLMVAFFKAAFVEKGISFVLIFLLVFSFERKKDILKIVVAGIQYAAGFSFLENIIYLINFDSNLAFLRLISSVPMHLSTCGIQSFFIGLSFFYSLKRFKFLNIALAFVIPVSLHGFYDFFTFHKEEEFYYFIGPMIVLSVYVFEILFSKTQIYPKWQELKEDNLRFEDWDTLQTQKGYQQWILYSSGTKNLPVISFFRFQKDYIKLTISFIMLMQSFLYYIFPEFFLTHFQVRLEFHYTLFFVMPISFSIMFFILGSVNPEYFKNKKIAIPIILDVDILLPERNVVHSLCYELKTYSTFLESEEEFKEGTKVLLIFHYRKDVSYPIQSKIVKCICNENSKGYPSGIVVVLNKNSKQFLFFYYKYWFYRILNGFVFLLNLPGSDKIREFFVKPLTIMQVERTYKKGDIIFRQGDLGKQFYLIKKGKVSFYRELDNREKVKISELGPGEIFGEMALVSGTPRSATAMCSEDCILAVAHKDHLDALIQSNPEFVMQLIHNLVKILRKREEQLDDYQRLLEEHKKLESLFQEILNKIKN